MVEHAGVHNGRRGTVTNITWPFDFSNLSKNFVFGGPHSLHHLADFFELIHSEERFRKAPFLVIENTLLTWTAGQTGGKRCVFKSIRISLDGSLYLLVLNDLVNK